MTTNGAFTTLASFNGTNGFYPNGPLLEGSDGVFYGTAASSGSFGGGGVFKVNLITRIDCPFLTKDGWQLTFTGVDMPPNARNRVGSSTG